MGSSILSEVDDTSILRTGLSFGYWRPLIGYGLSALAPAQRAGAQRLCAVALFLISPICATRTVTAGLGRRPQSGSRRLRRAAPVTRISLRSIRATHHPGCEASSC